MTSGWDLAKIAGLLASRWKLILICTVAVMAIAMGYRSTVDEVFEATATIHYTRPQVQGIQNPYADAYPVTNGLPERDMQTLRELALNQPVLARAGESLGMTEAEVRRANVLVMPNANSDELLFTARDGDPERAAEIATAYAKAFVADRLLIATRNIDAQIESFNAELNRVPKVEATLDERLELQREIGNLERQRDLASSFLKVAKEAQIPEAPAGPPLIFGLLAAAIAGMGLGCGVALLTAGMDRKLSVEQLEELPAPVLVKVPLANRAPATSPLAPSLAEPLVADAFSALGSRLMLDRTEGEPHVILVSSARASEGKSTVAANLASALAHSGRRVILVDADMRRPTQDIIFPSLQGRPGLSQILIGQAEVESALTLVAPNLAGISSGPRQVHASALLASLGFRTLIQRLGQISDAIIIDAPPVLPVTDGLALAPAAHQVLLCVRLGASNLREIEEAHAKLAAASSTPQAVVVLGAERPTGYGYGEEVLPPGFGTSGAPAPPQQLPPPGSRAAAS